MLRQFIASEPRRKKAASGPPFCYQQGENDCGYYCLRIAAETVVGRKFNEKERRVFRRDFLSLCLMSGERLEKSTEEFGQVFPDMGVYFTTEQANEYSPASVVEKLDAGEKVLVLNIQNMTFSGATFVRGRYGHNVCCIGHKNGKLIFADSNRPCRKTMDISLLQTGYEALKATEGADDVLDARKTVLRTHPTHISEMFWVTKQRPAKKARVRRGTRRRSYK